MGRDRKEKMARSLTIVWVRDENQRMPLKADIQDSKKTGLKWERD